MNVFSELNKSSNDDFLLFNKTDLEHILTLINKYKLELRSTLDIPLSDTFGLEIECEYANKYEMILSLIRNWKIVNDSSLESGVEINSPILTDTKESWEELKKVCKMASKYSKVGENCGGHIHIGKQVIGKNYDAIVNFMKLWAVYEPVIFRFSYGEFLGPRPKLLQTAKPVSDYYLRLSEGCDLDNIRFSKLMYYLTNSKYLAVNFRHFNTLGTLEFRCPNGSFNPVVWQNNVNLFLKMLIYSSSSKYNYDFINEKISKLESGVVYDKINVNDALEFIDLIFDNNLDKVYFLRQYLKSFEEECEYKKAKTFCKTR